MMKRRVISGSKEYFTQSQQGRAEVQESLRFQGLDISGTASEPIYSFFGVAVEFFSRAVHCNVGKPDLWVYLPSD